MDLNSIGRILEDFSFEFGVGEKKFYMGSYGRDVNSDKRYFFKEIEKNGDLKHMSGVPFKTAYLLMENKIFSYKMGDYIEGSLLMKSSIGDYVFSVSDNGKFRLEGKYKKIKIRSIEGNLGEILKENFKFLSRL